MEDSKYKDAYFAGLIDGEGSLFLAGSQGRATIELKMTCFATVDALHQEYGGTVRYRKAQRSHWLDQWLWRVRDVQAREVLRRVRPFMITKAGAADVLIRKWEARGTW